MYVVGIGPGDPAHLSQRAREVLLGSQVIVGYRTYIDLIAPMIAGKEIVRTGMTKEVDRVSAAVDLARQGKTVALVSSGDPGIYAMAGLVFEICVARSIAVMAAGATKHSPGGAVLPIEVIPGIPALCAGAALLGAPLMHDFAAISLSDLLTPWEVIERRLHAVAGADFVLVIYNPKSKKRNWQLEKARQIALSYRDPQTPVGIVTAAMRKEQRIALTTLEELHKAEVDMQTTVFIGNSTTTRCGDFLYTMRGYAGKYEMGDGFVAE
ncbi:MAG: precorrin-3B C(17)-methyltransferase [Thermodesulfobacteriota bacterium]|nr:precorrin-3B C(17)-methyltransferase [Thermodesulfobacteriota bacterium]